MYPSSSASSSSLSDAYSCHALPSLFLVGASSSSSRGTMDRSTHHHPTNHHATNTHESGIFNSTPLYGESGFMFGVAQEVSPYRSVLVPRESSSHAPGFNPLQQTAYQARAVDVQAPRVDSSWYASIDSRDSRATVGFDFGGVDKQQHHSDFNRHREVSYYAAGVDTTSAKELSLPRLSTVLVSAPTGGLSFLDLPRMPAEWPFQSTSFSCPVRTCSPQDMWVHLQTQLQQTGAIMAPHKQRCYQLTCSSTLGVSCTEFDVRCYSGHYRRSTESESFYTIEWRRNSGCAYASMQLFKHLVRVLSASTVGIETDINLTEVQIPPSTLDLGPGGVDDSEGMDMSDVDMSALAIPSLVHTTAAQELGPTLRCTPTDSSASDELYTSLIDLITSDTDELQVQGLCAAAQVLDGTHPLAGALMCEVAKKLAGSPNSRAQVRQVASRLIEQASRNESTAAVVVKHCLPTVLANLAADADSSPLDAAHDVASQKHLLRSCVSLCDSVPLVFDMDGGSGLVGQSRLKRELLRITTAPSADMELRGLAAQTIQAIQV